MKNSKEYYNCMIHEKKEKVSKCLKASTFLNFLYLFFINSVFYHVFHALFTVIVLLSVLLLYSVVTGYIPAPKLMTILATPLSFVERV